MLHSKYELEIFIAGIAPDIQMMIVDLKDELNKLVGNNAYTLKVVDVLEKPELAEEHHILATPTFVRISPEPLRKVILNLNQVGNLVESINLILSGEI